MGEHSTSTNVVLQGSRDLLLVPKPPQVVSRCHRQGSRPRARAMVTVARPTPTNTHTLLRALHRESRSKGTGSFASQGPLGRPLNRGRAVPHTRVSNTWLAEREKNHPPDPKGETTGETTPVGGCGQGLSGHPLSFVSGSPSNIWVSSVYPIPHPHPQGRTLQEARDPGLSLRN